MLGLFVLSEKLLPEFVDKVESVSAEFSGVRHNNGTQDGVM